MHKASVFLPLDAGRNAERDRILTLFRPSLGWVTAPSSENGFCQEYRLYQCPGCEHGALARLLVPRKGQFPKDAVLAPFEPESIEQLPLPASVPGGIVYEFREVEQCLSARCNRAAAGMFRSVLDKTMRANGYKLKPGTSLQQQIDLAVDGGVITKARSLRAHEDVRTLGNDVLHEEWKEISEEDVLLVRHYAQRILEDLYDDRPAVMTLLKAAGRDADDMIPF